jgi:17beta-estradiol 17-dehydrogenase / very-long-chain 3-oxoacyl-CoA reductase
LSHTGAIALALVALSVLRWVWSYFLTSSDLSRYGAKKGAWAVVTGASDGIGKVRAAALAC